jgi:transcriptional regulator with XRE-family HTH domain
MPRSFSALAIPLALVIPSARMASVNRTYLSKLEKGASYPGLEIIAKLATVLDVEGQHLPDAGTRAGEIASRSNQLFAPLSKCHVASRAN